MKNITMVAIEWQWYDLTKYAIEHSLNHINPSEVLIISDREILPGARHVIMPPVNGMAEYANLMLKGVAEHINTDHALYVQWDGLANNQDMWTDDFLNYDYIGAPWPWKPEGENVGNGGFSLRSRRLLDFIANSSTVSLTPEEPVAEDAVIAGHKQHLEQHGFSFAPTALAEQFSFELGQVRDSFGFHGAWNFITYMSDTDLDYIIPRMSYKGWNVYKWHHVLRAAIDRQNTNLYTYLLEQLTANSPELLQPVAAWLEREGNNEQRIIL